MEELRKLEKVQRMVEFMESRGVSNSDHHSNRFLANLMLLLIEPCGELGMDDERCLVSELIPRLSSAFLEDAYQHIVTEQENSGFQENHVGNALLSCNQMTEYSLLQSYNENMAMVGLDSMQKANSTLEDFDDVLENNFNILRMFIRIYGASSAPAMLVTDMDRRSFKFMINFLPPF